MDKVRFLLLLGLWAVLLPGCGKDGINEGPKYIPGQNGDIVFDIGFAPRTRVSTGADFKSTWENGDEIGVYAVAHDAALASSDNYIHNVKLTYNSADGGSWEQETPLYWLNDGTPLDFYAYYPYDEDATAPAAIAFNVKADQSAATSGKNNYNLSDLLTAKSDNGDGWEKGSTVALTFNHALAMVQLTIDDAIGALDVNEDIVVTLRGVRTGCALNLGTPESTTADEVSNVTMCRVEQPDDADYNDVFTFRALVPAQTLAEGASLFRIANGDLLLSGSALTADLILAAGQAETFTQETPLLAVIQSEANCYMVRPGGRSLLIPVSQANRVLTADGLGATTTDLGGVTADNYTVELVWGDLPVGADGVIEELRAEEIDGKGYVYVKSGVAGNAVVCIKVGDVIKWSWHIWVTEPVGKGTDTETGLTWMDRHLGATANTPLVNGVFEQAQWVKTLGMFYQWGRKDAFPSSDGTDNNQIYYTPDNPTGTTAALPTGSYTELPDMVQNPLNFAWNSRTYCGSLNVEGETNDSWGGVSGAKTLYDPCPAGWRVPENGKWSSISGYIIISNDEWAIFANNGRVFNGVNGTSALGHFYPAVGYRYLSSSIVSRVGNSGDLWQAAGHSTSGQYAYAMSFHKDGMHTNNNYDRSNGFSVRCVAEE